MDEGIALENGRDEREVDDSNVVLALECNGCWIPAITALS